MAGKKNEINFEKSLAELEQLVETMEKGDLSLEESLKNFERGVALTRACQKALEQAEQRVQILSGDGDAEELAPFEEGDAAAKDDDAARGASPAQAKAAPGGKKTAAGAEAEPADDNSIPF